MDACSVINLHNGGVLEVVCSIESIDVQIGPIAGGECSEDCATALANLHEAGRLEYLEDTPIDADEFLEFVAQHKLGDGEAECIMLAELSETATVCCDDMRGRRKTEAILGQDRLVGSLKLLKQAVTEGLFAADQAFAAYELMKGAGGFLPEIDAGYFSSDD
jgi:predicted nucleic acid-binding protein